VGDRVSSATVWSTCGQALTPPDRYTDVPVRVMTLDEDVKQVRAGTIISDLEPVTVLGPVDSSSAQLSPATSSDLPECMQELIDGVDPETPKEVVARPKELMMRYDQIFSKSETDLGLTSILTQGSIQGQRDRYANVCGSSHPHRLRQLRSKSTSFSTKG